MEFNEQNKQNKTGLIDTENRLIRGWVKQVQGVIEQRGVKW